MNSNPHRKLMFDTIENISQLTSPPLVADAFFRAVEGFGFAALGINDLPRPEEGANPIILTETTPSGFRDCYIQEQFYLIDHIGAHTRTTNEPFRYSEAPYHQTRAREHARFMQLLDTFGMGKGLVVPLGHSANLPACVWLAGKDPDLDDDAIRAIQLMALFASSKARTLSRPLGTSPPCNLTPREREVLTWVAQGKSAWEIGEILNIAQRTVEEHAKKAIQKLDALNRAHAVAVAVRDQFIAI
jgi:LuxR family transcriptional regulator, quorum-sensing system regulator BjaR1